MIIAFTFPNIPLIECYFQIRTDIYSTRDNISFECGLDKDTAYATRKALFAHLAIKEYSEVAQVHGSTVIYSPITYRYNQEIELLQEADAIASDKENCALLVKTADCQPLLFADASGKYIMAFHVGWRANAQHYIQKVVAEFCERYNLLPNELSVVRGPSLSPLQAQFIHAEKEFHSDDMCCYNYDTKTMDLWRMTRIHLEQAGVLSHNIYGIDICTYSSPFLFSYRRESQTGRQCSIILIRKNGL